MFTTTTQITVKNHTLQLNDFEIEQILGDPQPLLEKLSELLTSRPEPNGDRPARKKIARRKTHREKLGATMQCPKCGQTVKTRGLLIHQRGSKCRERTAIED